MMCMVSVCSVLHTERCGVRPVLGKSFLVYSVSGCYIGMVHSRDDRDFVDSDIFIHLPKCFLAMTYDWSDVYNTVC